MIDVDKIEKLRVRGLVERTSDGLEAVRVTAQCRLAFDKTDYAALRETMQQWEKSIAAKFARHGGEVVPGSLSVAGQTIELLVPAKTLASIDRELDKEGVRLDLIEEHSVTLDKKL